MNFKRDAFNIVSIAIQNTILPEIVSVQPMTTAAQLVPVLELRYGTTKGEVTEGDLVIDSTGNGKTNKYYDSKIVKDQKIANAGETTVTVVIPFTPVDAGSVKIVAGDVVITDDAAGKLTGTGVTSGTIDYAQGTATFTLNSAATADIYMSYTYNNANVPTPVGDITMGINPVLNIQ